MWEEKIAAEKPTFDRKIGAWKNGKGWWSDRTPPPTRSPPCFTLTSKPWESLAPRMEDTRRTPAPHTRTHHRPHARRSTTRARMPSPGAAPPRGPAPDSSIPTADLHRQMLRGEGVARNAACGTPRPQPECLAAAPPRGPATRNTSKSEISGFVLWSCQKKLFFYSSNVLFF